VATVTAATVPGDPVLAAAGDIACDSTVPEFHATLGSGSSCQMRATSDLLLAMHPDVVATLGDNQYSNASLTEFESSFDPTWGRLKAQIHPAIGNHEIETDPTGSGYFDYFGAAAGDPTKGYYSYNLGAWHVVVLNGNCALVGGCGGGSAQEQWLSQDLAAQPPRLLHPRLLASTPLELRCPRGQRSLRRVLAGSLQRRSRGGPQRP
jgi:hypothetical protein